VPENTKQFPVPKQPRSEFRSMAGEGVMSYMEIAEQPINVTSAPEALSPWLNNPRRTVIQVEVFMSAATALLFLQLLLGSMRRRSSRLFIQGGLWLVYTLQPPLITYTLGLMQSSPVKSRLYPVWALSLFLVTGGANAITAYDLDDNKQWKRRLFTIFQYCVYSIIIVALLETGKSLFSTTDWHQPVIALVYSMAPVVITVNMFGAFAGWMVNCSDPCKVVADYMKGCKANSRGGSRELDAATLKGCKYLVHWCGYKTNLRGETEVQKENAITVEMIWDKCNGDLFSSQGLSSRIKGACLSFSLSHLLRRRFFGMDCAEANLQETRQFVLQVLLSENSNIYTEAFRVIEVELGFLYDFFYTKYASIFEMETCFFAMVILKMICTFAVLVVLHLKSPFLNSYNPVIEVNTRGYDTTGTEIILAALLVVEALQSILYLGSDWAVVSFACHHITRTSHGIIPFTLRKLIVFLCRLPTFSYWQKKIGQFSVIEGSRLLSPMNAFSFETTTRAGRLIHYFLSLWNPFSSKGVNFVGLTDTVKAEIVHSLKSSSDGHLTNGRASLQRNRVFGKFSWTLENETQAERMLIWHIATDYCRIKLRDEAEVSSHQHREVATKLSGYCAYLMSKAPELLPGNFADTKFVFDHVICEAKKALGTKRRDRDVLLHAIENSRGENTVFTKGLELGTMLQSMDMFQRWKVLAEFWAETILYIAPCDNTKAHMEHLAQGGEFLTHIWALLTHAGILTRPQPENPDPVEGIA
jgi:hypothetical protein